MSLHATLPREAKFFLFIVAFVAANAAPARAEPAGEFAIAVLKWQGEYGTDQLNGGPTTETSSEIYVITAGDRAPRPITSLGKVATYPRFHPTGEWLYFQSNATGNYQIYRCRPDGSELTNISAKHGLGDEWNYAFGPSLSADGRKIVYSVMGGQPTPRIVYADSDGANAQWIMPELGYIYMASLDGEGERVAFSGPARGYRLSLSGAPFSSATLLTPDHPDSYVPQFTPDGNTLIFLRIDGDLYSQDLASQAIRRITTGKDYVEFRLSPKDLHGSTDGPSISPDGKRLAYIAKKDGIPQLFIASIDGAEPRQLSFRTTPCGRARFSPDGKRVGFVSFIDKYPQLFVIDAGGGEPRQITTVDGAVNWYDWRPERTNGQ